MADFGTDFDCVNDVDATGRMVTGNLLVAQAVARRWSTPAGGLIGDPNYGYDLNDRINEDMDPREIAAMNAELEAQALLDERVTTCTVSSTLAKDGTLTVIGDLEAGNGPFRMTVSVSEVAGLILVGVT